jgi:hypothetical protein
VTTTHFDESPSGMESPISCFVIGPIGDKQAPFGSDERLRYEQSMEVWDYVIKPACDALGIEPVRADMIAQPGEITEQMFQHLRHDDLVIADVTGGNANVMYEPGLRHTTNGLTIQLGERERHPFDITVIRTIRFNRTETGLVEARTALQQAITAGLDHGAKPVTATRVWLGSEIPASAVPEIIKPDEQEEGPGFLDMLAETEEATPLLAQVSEELTAVFEELPALTDAVLEEMAKSDARGKGASGRLVIAQKLAGDLEDPTSRIEQLAADFVGQLERIDPGISYLVVQIEENPQLREDDDARQFIAGIGELAGAAKEGLGQVGVLADTVQGLGQISNRLRPITRRMSTALRRISNSSQTIQEWGRRLDAIDFDAA